MLIGQSQNKGRITIGIYYLRVFGFYLNTLFVFQGIAPFGNNAEKQVTLLVIDIPTLVFVEFGIQQKRKEKEVPQNLQNIFVPENKFEIHNQFIN